MDNPEEVLHSLEEFAKLKHKNIPRELEDYLMYVARTGDPVYQWQTVKILFREKLLSVITEFYETTPTLDISPSPNVDPFNYETMKSVLLERLEAFSNAPFTVQRLCELLTTPRKEYNRPDKFMRAIEKNILVVSTREPGGAGACRPDSALSEPIPNGVSEPPEATSNQSSSSSTSSMEETIPPTTSSEPLKEPEENGENHIASESTSIGENNHIDMEQLEPSAEAEARKEQDDESESTVKDVEESAEATDSSDSVTFGDVNCAADVLDSVNVSSSECSSVPEISDVLSESVAVKDTAENFSSSSEVKNADETVSEATVYEMPVAQEKKVEESEVDIKGESKESDEVSSSPQPDLDKVISAAPEPSESTNEPNTLAEESAEVVQEAAPSTVDSSVSSAQNEQPADSTESSDSSVINATEKEEELSSEAVSSVSAEVETTPELSVEKLVKETEQSIEAVPESSEAAPVSEKLESEAKVNSEVVKSAVDAIITSTAASTGTASGPIDMEAMDVDESSNQPSEASAADGEAMEVADEDEPMEVCEDSASGSEEMTTSPQDEPAA
ncbi:Serine/threonine-protein phosphatase 4 regulatory subunit 2 [Frankliniella fusca]|uniref:Serine/threonine-protein phosphatase 4 regulatory subunit 2 n=1 Tax=Frankliniella fusca TaxID=407009 RepID=A0AAE1GVI9_9NEOP|nr:Serine/threonine-protein phosphatase 4 regulatory subunit 2 [Frankliniella fusca]